MKQFGFPVETIVIFFVVISLSVYLDLFAHKKSKEITITDASAWSVFWIALALGFYVYLWYRFDREWADLYLTGYVLEKSLSVDNLIVFTMIFSSFSIKDVLQHHILYWGIMGALVFRAIFVFIGTGLLLVSPWVGFVFAAIVVLSAWKMLQDDGDNKEIKDYSNHWSVRLVGWLVPVYTKLHLDHFFVGHRKALELCRREDVVLTRTGWFYATPAFLCLAVIETSDVVFAFDSVPAVIAVTQQPLLVYAAMIFAILGLRSLYFVLAALKNKLAHLNSAVICLLFFIAAKMTLQSWNHAIGDTGIHIPPAVSLAVILLTLAAGIIASFLLPVKEAEEVAD